MSTATISTKRMSAEEFYAFVHRPENQSQGFELVRVADFFFVAG